MVEYEGSLKQAQGIQEGVLEGMRGDHPDLVAAHKQAAAEVQLELAHLYASQQKPDQVPLQLSVCLSVCLSAYVPSSVTLASLSGRKGKA